MKRELLAQIVNPAVPSLKDPEKAPQILGKFVSGFIGLLLVAATIWAFVNLLLGAFNWISSGGDKGKLETAEKKKCPFPEYINRSLSIGISACLFAVFR